MHHSPCLFPPGVAVVIGGSGGVGRAICEKLAAQGCDVALSYRGNHSAAEAAADAVRRHGRQALCLPLTLTDDEQLAQAFAQIRQTLGPIHTLVNAAGANIPMRYLNQIQPAQFQDVIEGDLNGFYNLLHCALPYLRESQGAIVAVSSIGLRKWPKRDALSVVPKAGIEALLQGIAKEEGRFGVRANSVQLGVIEAGIFLRLTGVDFDPTWVESARENTALKRFGQAEDVAEAVCFLASNRAAYITGQALKLDGGFSI